MTATTSSRRAAVPARHLQVLSTFWLPAALLCGLVALGAAGIAVRSLAALLGAREPGQPLTADVVGLVVGGLAAVVLGLITWRLAVVVPRDLKAWRSALDERREALRD